MSVEINIVDSSKLSETSSERKMTRLVKVTGLDINSSAPARLNTALNENGVPRIGDPHEAVPGLFVVSREATGVGPTHVDVRLEYSTRTLSLPGGQNATIRYSSGVEGLLTFYDATGKKIEVEYTGPNGNTEGPVAGSVTKRIPRMIVTAERTELNDPLNKIKSFVGTVNQGNFLGDQEGQWLCSGITASSDDNGITWRVSHTFDRTNEPQGWRGVVFYVRPGESSPPFDIPAQLTPSGGNGIAIVPLYELRNFNTLGLF